MSTVQQSGPVPLAGGAARTIGITAGLTAAVNLHGFSICALSSWMTAAAGRWVAFSTTSLPIGPFFSTWDSKSGASGKWRASG